MSVATLASPTATRSRRTRTRATLTLIVEGVPYDVRCFDYDDSESIDGLSGTGMEHSLCGPDGERFRVYGVETNRSYCQCCGRDGCPHIRALDDVGLLG
jgi:hypothetical protein